jgi:hypothetical protein
MLSNSLRPLTVHCPYLHQRHPKNTPSQNRILPPLPRPSEANKGSINEDPSPIPSSMSEPMDTEDTPQGTASAEPPQRNTEMYTAEPISRSSYATYTDLISFSSDVPLNVPLPSTFSPSTGRFQIPIKSRTLLNTPATTAAVAFPQPLQDHMAGLSGAGDNGSLDIH